MLIFQIYVNRADLRSQRCQIEISNWNRVKSLAVNFKRAHVDNRNSARPTIFCLTEKEAATTLEGCF